MNPTEAWYVVKQTSGQCTILPASQMADQSESDASQQPDRWGPYSSQQDAIAHRVGLIRAGKCQPV